jgi:hypothetical protein
MEHCQLLLNAMPPTFKGQSLQSKSYILPNSQMGKQSIVLENQPYLSPLTWDINAQFRVKQNSPV